MTVPFFGVPVIARLVEDYHIERTLQTSRNNLKKTFISLRLPTSELVEKPGVANHLLHHLTGLPTFE
ncbi:MAG TPA: hypothetical protein VIZ28_11570, partial [Chitinophagaceae bacterium]